MAENTGNIGFEETLWKAADKLRGSMDASEYKHVVLGLIFLKYISDKFETKFNALVEEGAGFEELELLTLGALRKAVVDGDVKNGTVMAGQIAGLIKKEQTCSEIIKELIDGMSNVIEHVRGEI